MFREEDFIIGKSGKSIFGIPAVGDLIISIEANDKDCAINLPFVMRSDSGLDEKKFEAAINRVIRENDALRAVAYMDEKGEGASFFSGVFNTGKDFTSGCKVRFLKEYTYRLEPVEVDGEYEECRSKVLSMINASIRKRMDIENDVPFRIDVYKSSSDSSKYWLAFYVNHYVCDPSTLAMMIKAIFGYYFNEDMQQVFGAGSSFMEYLEEISDESADSRSRELAEFWEKEYEGYQPVVLSRRETKDLTGLPKEIVFSRDILASLAEKNSTSIFNVVLFLYHMAYRIIFGTNDSSVAFAVNGRKEKQYVTTLGCFIQVVNSRLVAGDSESVADVIKRLRKTVSAASSKSSPVMEYKSPFIISYQEVKDLGTDKMPFEPEVVDTSYLAAPGIAFTISEGSDHVIGGAVIDANYYSGKNVKAIADLVLALQDKLGEMEGDPTVGELLSGMKLNEDADFEVIDI